MKKLLILLSLCLLIPAYAMAFDLSPYEIETVAGTVADLQSLHIDRGALEGQPYRLFSSGGVHIGFRETEGEPAQFMLYDASLQCFASGLLPGDRAELCSLYDDGDAVILSLFLPMKPKAQFLAARIGKDSQADWQYLVDCDPLGGSSVALPDGAGSAWLAAQVISEDPYAGTALTHISAQGEAESVRTLRTGQEILLAASAVSHPESACATLYCPLVAKSKGVYTALAITLDPQGSILDVQARDYSAGEDTGFTILTDAEGTPWVYSRGALYAGGKGVLIPFDALPALSSPGIFLD